MADVGEELRLQLVQLLGLLVEARELFVGSPELPVRVVQLAGPQVDLGLHLLRAAPELFGELRLLGPLLLEADELRHVFDPVDDVRHPAVHEDRRIDGAPVPLLEPAALGLGSANVVLLDRHGVGDTILEHPVERGSQVSGPGGVRVVGVVREDVEETAAEDLLPLGHRGAQIRIARCHDLQVRGQHEIEPGGRLEERPEVRVCHPGRRT